MTPRGIRPVRREPPLTPQELAAVPSDKRSTDPLLRLEEEIAALDKTLATLKSAQGLTSAGCTPTCRPSRATSRPTPNRQRRCW